MELVTLQIDEETGVARIALNRPDVLNALNVPMARDFLNVAHRIEALPNLRCIVLRGEGRAFMAGGDLESFNADLEHADATVGALLDCIEPVLQVFASHSAPIVASVHGVVAGAGLSLLAACDLAIAAQGTKFLLAYDRIAAPPDCGGSYYLPRLLGERRAAALMYLSEEWDADAALRNGLVNRVVESAELAQATDEMARQVASGPTRAYGMFKNLVREARRNTLDAQLAAERKAFCEAATTADFSEGVTAFLKRRNPHFMGS